MLTEEVVLQLRQSRPYVSLDPLEDDSYEIRIAVPFFTSGQAQPVGVLQAHYPVTSRIGLMASAVERSYQRYTELLFLREDLRACSH